MRSVSSLAEKIWQYLREASGENDYVRYCERVKLRGEEPPSPRAFYLEQLERKNSRPTRCC